MSSNNDTQRDDNDGISDVPNVSPAVSASSHSSLSMVDQSRRTSTTEATLVSNLSSYAPSGQIATTSSADTRTTTTFSLSTLPQSIPEHDEVAAANAEAMRLAVELGVASSVRNNERKPGLLRQMLLSSQQQPTPPPTSTGVGLIPAMSSPRSSNTTSGFLPPLQEQPQPLNTTFGNSAFHAIPSDVRSSNASLVGGGGGAGGLLGQYYAMHNNNHHLAGGVRSVTTSSTNYHYHQQQHQYKPPSLVDARSTSPMSMQSLSSFAASDASQNLHIFDCHGQRTPYREGPYFVHPQKDGRRIKKRWYGRLEDGYLAWSSIYLHEIFGFTIYTPLTPDQHRRMKESGKPPKWMNEFSSLPNLAIPLSYFCIGVALQLLRTPLIVYFIEDLNATPAEVNVLFTVMAVPWCFKVLYGFLSDCLPISGLRRKPYFMTGWLVYIVSNLILMISPIPSIQLCILLVFTQTAGYMLADVMTDALIVERSRYETQDTRGTMQSQGYIIRFFGSTIGATIGAIVYNKDTWRWYLPMRLVFFINAACPMIFLLPVVPYLLELETDCVPKKFLVQCKELFETAQLRSVWQPMTFVYVYNALQLTNAAWMNFLVEGLEFTAWQIGIVSIVGSVMAWFGIMTYKRFFFASNWRIVYLWCTTLASVIALGQLILVFGWNRSIGLRIGFPGPFPTRQFEIPDIWFSMGDDVLVEFVIAVQFLPMCIMYLGLCPEGSEGTTYAMLTTWSNLAGSLAFDISTALTAVWDVSSATIEAGDYSGVWKLSLLSGLMGPLPLILLGLIPKDRTDQRRLQEDKTRHYWAGVLFISVMIVTLIITFAESVYEVYFKSEGQSLNSKR